MRHQAKFIIELESTKNFFSWISQIVDALDSLPPITNEKPTMLICNTIKGKGVSFMEKVIGWHVGTLSTEDMEKAIAEVEAACAKERIAA